MTRRSPSPKRRRCGSRSSSLLTSSISTGSARPTTSRSRRSIAGTMSASSGPRKCCSSSVTIPGLTSRVLRRILRSWSRTCPPAPRRAKVSNSAPSCSTGSNQMSYATIEVKPVTPLLGAEIFGIDLTGTLSNQQVDDLHTALAQHQVLFFRDQKITLDQQKTLGRHFGDLHIHPNTPGPEGHPEILPIHADANSKRIAGERWHSDVSCDVEPPLGSILNLKTIPSSGGDTLFCSMYAAYDALSAPMKSFLSGLTAIHDGAPNYSRTNNLIGDAVQKSFPT